MIRQNVIDFLKKKRKVTPEKLQDISIISHVVTCFFISIMFTSIMRLRFPKN